MITGAVFPGYSFEVVTEKKIQEINKKEGGRLTLDKDTIFIECKDEKGNFRFRFSSDKNDYSKCANCVKTGLIDKIYCLCKEVSYCS